MVMLTSVIAGAAGVALAGCLWQIGTRLRALESRRDEVASVPETSGKRSSKPMLGALYTEPPASPLSGLKALPGGPWLGTALALGIMAILWSGFAPASPTAEPARPDSTLVRLQGRVDSLTLAVGQLRDSMQLGFAAGAVPAAAPEKAKPVRTKLRQAPVQPSGGVLAAPPPPLGTPAP